MNKNPVTLLGEQLLRSELEELKAQRPELARMIAESRSLGDLKENAEYHANREKQGLIEARIEELENKISNMQVIDVSKLPKTGKVVFGASVKIKNLKKAQNLEFQIVGEDESANAEDKISIFSPLAKALIGHVAKDKVEVELPNGSVQKYEILEVIYK